MPRTPGRDFAGVVVAGPEAMLGREVWGTGKELGFVRDVGINSLLHDTRACARMLERFGPAFDSGALPRPQGIRERPLDDAVAAYAEVDRGAGEKIVFVP